MHKWIAGSTCAAAVLSLAVASAQTYPKTPDDQTKPPSTRSGSGDTPQTPGTERRSAPADRSTAQRVTMTGCLMQSTDARNKGWILSNALPAAAGTRSSTAAGDREGTTGAGVSGSTSTGTSGARTDTEAQGAAGATGTSAGASASGTTYRLEGVKNPDQYKNKRVEVVGTVSEAGKSGNQMLRVTSVRAAEGSCP